MRIKLADSERSVEAEGLTRAKGQSWGLVYWVLEATSACLLGARFLWWRAEK